MYLLDPDRGRSRRAKLADKTASMYHDSADFARKVQRDARNRATGMLANTRAMFRHEADISDPKLEARIRTKLGRASSHPHAIRVTALERGVVLDGHVLAGELDSVLSAVRSTPGVVRVDNRLQVHDDPSNIPDLQGNRRRPHTRSEFLQANWSPSARVLAGAVGGGLALVGFARPGAVATIAGTLGAGLLARAVVNKDIGSLADLEPVRRLFAT